MIGSKTHFYLSVWFNENLIQTYGKIITCFPCVMNKCKCTRMYIHIFMQISWIIFWSNYSSVTDTELQLRRDVIFCQSLVGALCALAEQLVNALNLRFNNNGEYEEDSKEVSRKWLEQIATIGVLFNFQSALSLHVVRLLDLSHLIIADS